MIHRLGFFAGGVDLAITYHLMHMDIMIQNPLSLNSRDRSGLKARYLHWRKFFSFFFLLLVESYVILTLHGAQFEGICQ